MLQVKNITITEKKTGRTLWKNVSFVLNAQDKIAVIGEEGDGKSTLLKAIVDKHLVPYVNVEGQIIKQNMHIGYVGQFLDSDWNSQTVLSYFLKQTPTGEETYEIYERFAHLQNILATVGLSEQLLETNQTVGTLSGGEKVKLQFAKMLLNNPNCFILDEPTNDIDIQTLVWVESFLQSTMYPVLFISHDETLLKHVANGILHIEQTQKKTIPICTFERISYDEYVQKRANSLQKQEQIALKQRAQDKARTERWQQMYAKVQSQQNSISRQNPHGGRLLKKKMQSVLSQKKRFEKERESFTEIPEPEEAIKLKFSNVVLPKSTCVLSYNAPQLTVGKKVLANNIQLQVYGPQKVMITGANGTGKTTLLREIYTYMQQQKRFRVGYMPQNYEEELGAYPTVMAFLQSFCETNEKLTKARMYLGGLKFTTEETCGSIEHLSGGQKAKLYFLKLMLGGFDVLLLDEPTRNISPLSNPVLRKALASFSGAIIAVSHDRAFIKQVATHVYCLQKSGLHIVEER